MNKSFDHKATFKFLFIASKERKMFTLIHFSCCLAVLTRHSWGCDFELVLDQNLCLFWDLDWNPYPNQP